MQCEISYSTDFIKYLEEFATILFNVPLKDYTTFKCGGPVDLLMYPDKTDSISKIVKAANQENIPITVIGGGSNLLICDKGLKGIVLRISDDNRMSSTIRLKDDVIFADASIKKEDFIDFALDAGYKGIEFMAGIPGTIGGGIVMNAGTDMGSFIGIMEGVKIVDCEGYEKEIKTDNNMSSYRSFNIEKNAIITEGYFRLKKSGNINETRKKINSILEERSNKHPLDLPSAGSVFKNPEGYSSWELVNDTGLKGKMIGGAMVSNKHTNFIVNVDNASSQDILNLVRFIQEKVFNKFGIKLETEIRMVGDF